MRRQKKTPAAGGVLIAIGAIGGTIVGLTIGQVSAAFLIGTAIGVAGAVGVWMIDRAR